MSTSKAEQAAREWVDLNMTWDDYECQWQESGAKTFLAGREHFIKHELRALLEKAALAGIEKRLIDPIIDHLIKGVTNG